MNRRTVAALSAGLIVAIALVAIAVYFLKPSRQLQNASQAPVQGRAAIGQTAPEFVVATTGGLYDLNKGSKPVFLEVFATWCPHCARETAVVDRLYENYGSEVDFVGVSGSNTGMDNTSPATQLDVVDWIQKYGAKYPIAFDPSLNVANSYLQGAFPTLAVIDRNKKIVYLNTGEIPYGELEAAIKKTL